MSYVDEATLIESWIEGDQIVLDNVPLRVLGGVGYQLNNVYGTKQRQGEPGPDDHPYNSTHTQRTWVSGQLVKDLQEAADVGKYWRGHAWTQTRGMLGHALKVDRITIPAGTPEGMVVPHDRLGGEFYWTSGNVNGQILEHVEGPPHSLRTPGGGVARSFSGTVMNVGVTFRTSSGPPDEPDTWLYIPTTAGYTRMAPDFETIDAPSTTPWATVGFAIHENKLFRLTTSGQIWMLLDHDDDWTLVATMPDGSDPRNIWRDYDDDGNRVIMVSTSSGGWMLDADNNMIFETDLTFPEHSYQGYGAAAWRADTYISVGVGIHRKTGTLVVPAGLDSDDGLPAPYASGFITDLEPSYNLLVAAIAGELEGEDPSPLADHEAFSLTQGLPYPLLSRGTQANFLGTNRMGAIFCWNGLGWSEIFSWNRPPTRAVVTQVRSSDFSRRYQHLFFGDYDGGAWTVHLPTTYYNPLESPNLPLDRYSWLEESRIDWNTPDVPKVAKQLNLKVDRLHHTLRPDDPTSPTYQNRIEVVCNWRDLDGLDHTSEDTDVLLGPGPYPFSDGLVPVPFLSLTASSVAGNSRRAASIGWERYRNTNRLLATGLPHEQIWMTYRFIGDPSSDLTGGVIQWRTIIARKWMRPVRIWTVQVDAENAIKDLSEQATLEFLDSCCLKKQGVPFVHGDKFYIVDVTRLDGTDTSGLTASGARTITLLQHTDFTYEDPFG